MRRIILTALTCMSFFTNAQLIQNGGFESVPLCPNGAPTNFPMINGPGCSFGEAPFNSAYYPSFWLQAINTSPDLINSCGNTCNSPNFYICTWSNLMGCQNPIVGNSQTPSGGNNYMGIITLNTFGNGNSTTMREYLLTQINNSNGLTAGACYVVRFYVSRADECLYATPIQVAFSNANPQQVVNLCNNTSAYYQGIPQNVDVRLSSQIVTEK